MILDQQIELYFGDNYQHTLVSVRKFVATNYRLLLGWGANKDQLLDNEGGREGLLRLAFCHIIEEGDEGKGLRAYGKYLAHEYTPAYQRNHLRLEDVDPYLYYRTQEGKLSPLGETSASEEETELASLDILVEGWGLDQDEYDLATLLGNNNYSLKNAGAVLEWERNHVLAVYRRLRDRVKAKGVDGVHRRARRPAVVDPQHDYLMV